MTNDILGRR